MAAGAVAASNNASAGAASARPTLGDGASHSGGDARPAAYCAYAWLPPASPAANGKDGKGEDREDEEEDAGAGAAPGAREGAAAACWAGGDC